MALPKLDTPTYELEQPSTGETIKYRPFLVKEQKTLILASESDDDKQIKNALSEIIYSCTFEKVDASKLPIFDVEYLFLRIRGKSVGEKVDLSLLCPDDKETRVNKTIEGNRVVMVFSLWKDVPKGYMLYNHWRIDGDQIVPSRWPYKE